tara:strand:+ start:7789 stop:8295 length:507 start_codon:yes stop_codon:yes gene_type:complete
MTVLAQTRKQEMQAKVELWALNICDCLEENYKQYTLASHRRNIETGDEWSKEYHQEKIDAITLGGGNLNRYRAYTGRKYIKIVMQEFDDMGPSPTHEYRDSSVHAFIDKNTGEVYMPAGYNKPTTTGKFPVRFDYRIIKDREYLLNPVNTTWSGGYLYDRSHLPSKYI